MITNAQKIIEASDILEVISEHVNIKRYGSSYKGCCPFHDEKTPSFYVSPSKNIYKCFGCGKGGDVVKFLMEFQNINYPFVLKQLAQRAGIAVEETELSDEHQEIQNAKETLLIINKAIADMYAENLKKDLGYSVGYSYLKERKIKQVTIDKYNLGYSLNNYQVSQYLLDADYSEDTILTSGLVKLGDKQVIKDKFKERIIFPIKSPMGDVIGFGGRIIGTPSNKEIPKYLNSPETVVYNKSDVLYGLFEAKKAISKQNECIIVEGYLDVCSLSQAEIENVVSASGTSVTIQQLKRIARYTKNLTVIQDADAAGIKSATKVLAMAQEAGLNAKAVLLPSGEDPDTYVKSIGRNAFLAYIESNKQNLIDFTYNNSEQIAQGDKINYIKERLEDIAKIENAVEFEEMINSLSDRTNIPKYVLLQSIP